MNAEKQNAATRESTGPNTGSPSSGAHPVPTQTLLAPKQRPSGLVVANWGGGVNSTAALVLMKRLCVTPKAIVFADTGSEWPETYRYRDEVINPWLEEVGFPRVVTVTRWDNTGTRIKETLRENCARIESLPSIAFGFKRCSLKYKKEAVAGWVREQPWAIEQWANGQKLVRAIGYDAGESRRVLPSFSGTEGRRYVPWYPLHDHWMTRDDCTQLIQDEGLAVPRKSACYFCPSNTDQDWLDLRSAHPALFADALKMEETAESTIKHPKRFGLRRRGRVGEKQLRDWIKAYDSVGAPEEDEMTEGETLLPCECGL